MTLDELIQELQEIREELGNGSVFVTLSTEEGEFHILKIDVDRAVRGEDGKEDLVSIIAWE